MARITNEKVEVYDDPVARIDAKHRNQMLSGGKARNAPGRRDGRQVSWQSARNGDGMDALTPPTVRVVH